MIATRPLLIALLALPLGLPACQQKPADKTSEEPAPAAASSGLPASAAPARAPAAEAPLRQAITVDGEGFHPATIHAKAGQSVTLVFHRTTDATCAKQVVFKALGLRKDLPLNEDVAVTVTAQGPELKFACGMDMLKGAVVVEP